MELFKDGSKIDKLNEILCSKAEFPSCYPISTQTYTVRTLGGKFFLLDADFRVEICFYSFCLSTPSLLPFF
jgi:hypothetical protein